MAKSKSYFGLRRGSTKTHTFSVLRGAQVTKDRVYDIANPRTKSQMLQRAVFSTAVKFYKHAQQALFKFAFEDKRQNESDYNAFMRTNVPFSVMYGRVLHNSDNFPAIGNGWVLSNGSLPEAQLSVTTQGAYSVNVPSLEGNETTVGELSAALIADYGISDGDIVTIVQVVSNVSGLLDIPSSAPKWTVSQFRVSTSSAEVLSNYGIECAAGKWNFSEVVSLTYSVGMAVIFSRNVKGQPLKVSRSVLLNNPTAASIITTVSSDAYKRTALLTWGATESAILKGALLAGGVEPGPVPPVGNVITVSSLNMTADQQHLTSNILDVVGADSMPNAVWTLEVDGNRTTKEYDESHSGDYDWVYGGGGYDFIVDKASGDIYSSHLNARLISLSVDGVTYSFVQG